MQTRISLFLSSLLLLACAPEGLDDFNEGAADSGGTDTDTTDTEGFRDFTVYVPPGTYFRPGSTWGPCDLNDPWGCNGELGSGDACLRPVSLDDLTICAPQTWDPLIDDNCVVDGVHLTEPPFGLGVRVNGSAYCVPDCETDLDCGAGRKCSPTSHFCAWPSV